MDRSPRAHCEVASHDRSGRQRRDPVEGIASAPSSAAPPRRGNLGRWPDEHEPREGGHWYRSQYAACGRRCVCLRRSRVVRQPAWSVHFGCRSRQLSALARIRAFFAPAGQERSRSSATARYPATHKNSPAPSNRAGTPAAMPATGSLSKGYREPLPQHYADRSCADDRAGGSRQKAPDQPPFRICHIACITQFVPSILLSSDFSPGHRDLLRIFANPMESHPLRSLTLFQSDSKDEVSDPHGEERGPSEQAERWLGR